MNSTSDRPSLPDLPSGLDSETRVLMTRYAMKAVDAALNARVEAVPANDVYETALRNIAGIKPWHEPANKATGSPERMRCHHCGFVWQPDCKPFHALDCAYMDAVNALSAPLPTPAAPSELAAEWYLRTKCQDLLHLLSFADIRTPSEGDAREAEKVMASIREHLRQPASRTAAQWLTEEQIISATMELDCDRPGWVIRFAHAILAAATTRNEAQQ